jgi:hypothetical protein
MGRRRRYAHSLQSIRLLKHRAKFEFQDAVAKEGNKDVGYSGSGRGPSSGRARGAIADDENDRRYEGEGIVADDEDDY